MRVADSQQPVACREALDLLEGGALLVDTLELQGLPVARIHGLPAGLVARRLRADCILVGYRGPWGCMALKLGGCTLKPRHAEFLAAQVPPDTKEKADESPVS